MPDDAALLDALKQVVDPELMVNIVDLGLIYTVNQDDEGKVFVEMTLTSPACPAGPQLLQQSKMAVERVEGVKEATINLVMSPPWTPERMTDDARDQLGIF
jgi:metal-sulfur cluster biosynthetic enzyme